LGSRQTRPKKYDPGPGGVVWAVRAFRRVRWAEISCAQAIRDSFSLSPTTAAPPGRHSCPVPSRVSSSGERAPPRGRDTAARSLRNPHVQARLSRVRGFFSPAFRFFARCAAVDVRTHFWDCLGRCVRLVSRSKRIGGRQNEKCA
jgi:hypothetical protein